MRNLRTVLLTSCVLVVSAAPLSAREVDRMADYRPHRPVADPTIGDAIPDPLQSFSSAVQGTTWLASYTFDSAGGCIDEGWTSVDLTAQTAQFWHVDDFVSMGGNFQGKTGVIAGSKSLWCGARASSAVPICSYAALPGYGNSWDQAFCTKTCIQYGADMTVSFDADWDSEPGYDATTLEVTTCTGGVSDDYWSVLAGGIGDWDGNLDDFTVDGDTSITVAVTDTLYTNSAVKVRLRFVSDGAWSDEDGLWDTDGAFVVDNLQITGDLDSLPLEDFEDEAPGATDATHWESCVQPGYGHYAGLYLGSGLLQEDPCVSNVSCVWAFLSGSTADYSCGGHPEQVAVPYENERNQYINNEIWSPEIPVTGSGVTFDFVFDVYRDLPLDNLIFFVWHVRSIVDDCPGGWQDRNFVYYGANKDWLRMVQPIGDLIEPGASHIQVALGVIDMCFYWCGVYGTGSCHSHSPLFDNVDVYRVASFGPRWSIRDIDLFQDTFAEDGTVTGTARIDAALDLLPSSNPTVHPADSAIVSVNDPDNGLALDPSGWAAVYMYVNVDGPTEAAVAGTPGILTSDAFRWPVVGSHTDGSGDTWYILRADSAGRQGGYYTSTTAFCFDLNDSLFVPGDTVNFAFSAESGPPSGDVSYWTPFTGVTNDLAEALSAPGECTILPAGGAANGGDILYVDGMHLRGAQPYFDTAFEQLGIYEEVDRYDIRGPSSKVGNGPGARVVDALQQILPFYRKIIWNAGNLGAFGDGTTYGDKSNDAGLMLAFLDNLELPGGVYLNGDNLAQDWAGLAGSAILLRDTYMQHTVVNTSHTSHGIAVSPRVIGEPGGGFDHVTGPDTLIAYGGCPVINGFDVLAPTGSSFQEMRYDGAPAGTNGAVLSQYTQNNNSVEVGVVLSGFSFHYIRDDVASGGLDRSEHMKDILIWLGNQVPEPTDANWSLSTYSLSQNYPNPFNPTTAIDFTVKELTPVTVTIYNVRGQRVKTLASERFTPGQVHRLTWDGRNDAGQSVSSGVYFYKMVSKNFTQTRKMVLLK